MDTGYPQALAGDPAPAPEAVASRVLGMAHKSHVRHLAAVETDGLLTASGWPTNPRPARALLVLQGEANAHAPERNKKSDGMIGDARHQDEGSASDHNGWLKLDGIGIVRAIDLTNDPQLDLAAAFERARVAAHAGRLPQLTGGGYLILAGRITSPNFSGWRSYTGDDPHVSHGHVSLSRDPAGFDSTAAWGVFSPEQAPVPVPAPPAPAPAPPAPAGGAGWTGPDLVGAGTGLRGLEGNNGQRVADWQAFLNRYAPSYSQLAVDGWWGPATTAVNAEFGHRSGIPSADGLNIGPQLAAAYWRAGLFRPLSAARARVVGHITRAARR
jgi:hypothetical protein